QHHQAQHHPRQREAGPDRQDPRPEHRTGQGDLGAHRVASFTRGSTTRYSQSTSRLITVNSTADTTTMPVTTGKSRRSMAVAMIRPTPGLLNTVSTTTAPPSSVPTVQPESV